MMRFSCLVLLAASTLGAQQPGDGGIVDPKPIKTTAPGQGNAWFPITERDLGTYFHHEEARGVFPFKNPGVKPVEWRSLAGSCTCSKAVIRIGDRVYEMAGKPNLGQLFRVKKGPGGEEREHITLIQVEGGEEGEVEVHMDMNGITGVKQATLDVHTTDPDAPVLRLKFQATGAQMFMLNPAEVNLNSMTWNETREFSVQVTSPVRKDFNITRMDDPASEFKVHYDKQLKDGVATWTIAGTYGPLASEGGGGGGLLKFYTDLEGGQSFQVRVLALVKGPLELKPGGFLSLGLVRKGHSKTEQVTFEPNDGSDLQVVKVRFEKLTTDAKYVTAKVTKDGKSVSVEVEISADCPPGLVRGDMVVELNHPAIPEKRILFNGYVR